MPTKYFKNIYRGKSESESLQQYNSAKKSNFDETFLFFFSNVEEGKTTIVI